MSATAASAHGRTALALAALARRARRRLDSSAQLVGRREHRRATASSAAAVAGGSSKDRAGSRATAISPIGVTRQEARTIKLQRRRHGRRQAAHHGGCAARRSRRRRAIAAPSAQFTRRCPTGSPGVRARWPRVGHALPPRTARAWKEHGTARGACFDDRPAVRRRRHHIDRESGARRRAAAARVRRAIASSSRWSSRS